jgi:hypothetical protein
MEATRQIQLGAKLKEMLNDFLKEENRRKQPLPQFGIGNIIRRRQGQKEKRFFLDCPEINTVVERAE